MCIIPARGGSKRIPRKNIKDFLGKPIIAYSIKVALDSGLFDEVMVSTDDAEIAEVALLCGAKVPFLRSEANANDFATTADVLKEVLQQYAALGQHFDLACCIYATAPLIKGSRLIEGHRLLVDKSADTVFPVTKFSFPITRALKLENQKLAMMWPENLNKRSQDLPTAYHDAGQWYWFKTEQLLQSGKLLTDNTFGLELPEIEVQDIDNHSDWKLAEFKYAYLQSLT
nr:pseudaminic acid cytidylyltransferase [Penaeicola halotolerans]